MKNDSGNQHGGWTNSLDIPSSGIVFASGASLIGTSIGGPAGGLVGAMAGALIGIVTEVVSQKDPHPGEQSERR